VIASRHSQIKPQGEILLQGALDALERSLAFVETGEL